MSDETPNTANLAAPVIMAIPSAATGGHNATNQGDTIVAPQDSSNKRAKPQGEENEPLENPAKRQKGVAAIKAEYLIHPTGRDVVIRRGAELDDAAEAGDARINKQVGGDSRDSRDSRDSGRGKGSWKDKKKEKKGKGGTQNTSRTFGNSRDTLQLCNTRALCSEFSPRECNFGAKCRMEHDLRKYLKEGRREDLPTFGGQCPVYEVQGFCNMGWKCRFHSSHSEERETEDGRKELVLLEDAERKAKYMETCGPEGEAGVVNVVPKELKINLSKRKMGTPRSDAYLKWVNDNIESERALFDHNRGKGTGSNDVEVVKKEEAAPAVAAPETAAPEIAAPEAKKEEVAPEVAAPEVKEEVAPEVKQEDKVADLNAKIKKELEDNRAQYVEPPFRPSEKRRLYYGPETPVLAPLTTQGNMPFRRLCVELGAQVTWSEMAMGLPVLQGEKGEWALMKAHESEISPPRFLSKNTVVKGYDNAKDLKFGVQIAANKPWLAAKAVEVLTALCPQLRAIDLNCGCPINLVCEQGSGSALLDSPSKLENTLRGMNYVSNETPITVKIRMGTKDSQPTADKLVKRLVLGGYEAVEAGKGTSGVAAITLHGRSKQQRYTRQADWGYIADCSALINRLRIEKNARTDTVLEADPRDLANEGHVYFVGNGDCYSHEDYYSHLKDAKVDSVMVARGALIKPWIFEEIEKGQYLDKTATERLAYIEKFAKYGLQTWGSDEMGIGTTRRFLLEWLSFSCRYVPIGLLEHLPPHIQDRPPAFKGRDELETLMSSDNYKDWIKISEMFLGPAHPNFKFEPKHKSNSYEMEAEG